MAARVRAVDRLLPVAYHQRAAAVERAVLVHFAKLVGGRDCHQLEGRTRLVVVGNDRVAPGFHQDVDTGRTELAHEVVIALNVLGQVRKTALLVPFIRNDGRNLRVRQDLLYVRFQLVDVDLARQVISVIRVEVRQVRHGEHFAGLDVHNDAGNAVARLRIVRKRSFKVLFKVILNIAVDGQHERVAVLRRDVLLRVGHDVLVVGVLHAHDAARRAGKLTVVLRLDAVSAVVVAADVAEHRRKERAVLIVALGVGFGIDARAARCLQLGVQLLGDVLIDLLRNNFVFRIGLVQLFHHAVVADRKGLGKDGRKRLALDIGGHAVLLLGLGHNALGRYRDALDLGGLGEHLHIRVVDLAPVRGDKGVARLERRRLLNIEIMVKDLHIQQAQADQTEAGHDEKRCQHLQPHQKIRLRLFFSHKKCSSELR